MDEKDFKFMIQEAKAISVTNFQAAEVGMLNLHNEYFGEVTDAYKNKVRSQISMVYQICDEILRTACMSILHKKAKVFFPEQELEGWSIGIANIHEVMSELSTECTSEDVCREIYVRNNHVFRAFHEGFIKLIKLQTDEYEELAKQHRFHDEYVDDCEECVAEYIDDTREVAGLHRDYERMCK